MELRWSCGGVAVGAWSAAASTSRAIPGPQSFVLHHPHNDLAEAGLHAAREGLDLCPSVFSAVEDFLTTDFTESTDKI